jgi:hypothetical protein
MGCAHTQNEPAGGSFMTRCQTGCGWALRIDLSQRRDLKFPLASAGMGEMWKVRDTCGAP